MNDQTLKSKLLNTYLHQQQNNVVKKHPKCSIKTDLQENAVILCNDIPSISLEEFKIM
jgi:hypothetical protein